MDRPDSFLTILIALIVLAAIVFVTPRVMAKMRQREVAQPSSIGSDSAASARVRGYLSARKGWKALSPTFLTILASKFTAVEDVASFVEFCEQSGCLKQVVSRYHESADIEEGDMCLGAMATYLSSCGNALGDSGKLTEARFAFLNALAIYPLHTPTWASVCLVEFHLGNYSESIRWADRIIEFVPDPKSKYAWERSLADLADPKNQQRAAEALGVPAEDPLKEMKEQALELKAESMRKLR